MDHRTHIQSKTSGSIFSLKNLILCLGLIALGIAAIKVFNLPTSAVLLGALLLACPLLHVWMMSSGHKH